MRVVALDSQKIQSVSRKLLDTRRPLKLANALTNEEKEEMLIPYAPFIGEDDKQVISHNIEVFH